MDILELEHELGLARKLVDDLCEEARQQGLSDAWSDRFDAACDDCLRIERAISDIKGEATAIQCPALPRPVVKKGRPRLFCGPRTALVYRCESSSPRVAAGVQGKLSHTLSEVCIVRFEACLSARIGVPNDEVLRGHYLFGKGLAAYGGFCVSRSPLIRELEEMSSVHSAYRPGSWRGLAHYIVSFEDEMFECVARSFEVVRQKGEVADACRTLIEEFILD